MNTFTKVEDQIQKYRLEHVVALAEAISDSIVIVNNTLHRAGKWLKLHSSGLFEARKSYATPSARYF